MEKNSETLDWCDICYEDLAVLVTEKMMSRGREYLDRGQVAGRLLAGETLAASVLGSLGWYTVNASLASGRIETACTCPYQGGYCKHAAALILAWLTEPQSFFEPTASDIWREAGEEDLRRLCLELSLASPRTAVSLLTGRSPETGTLQAYAGLARNLSVLGRFSTDDLCELRERLAWAGPELFQALSHGDEAAAQACLQLAEKLLAAWAEAPANAVLTGLLEEYLQDLMRAWPAETRFPATDVTALCRPEYRLFAAEISSLALRSGRAAEVDAGPYKLVLAILESAPGFAPAAAADFDVILLLLDAYARWNRLTEAVALARAALKRGDDSERYVLRERLAGYHSRRTEPRQALAYMTVNFKQRPDKAGWVVLRRASCQAGEWQRIKKDIWPSVCKGTRDLCLQAAMDERDRDLLRELIADPGMEAKRTAILDILAEYEPEWCWPQLREGAAKDLRDGTRSGRKSAAANLCALARIARRQGWPERWEALRLEFRRDYAWALNWPELGCILSQNCLERKSI